MLTGAELALLEDDLGKGINLFLGAGFSTLAKNKFREALPTGADLKSKLIERFELSEYDSLDLPSIYAVLLADRRENLRAYLQDLYTVTEFDPRYNSLRKLQTEFVYTTNIDDLPFVIFQARTGEYSRILHDVYLYGAPRDPTSVVQFIPLHGSVRHEDEDFLFTAGQMASAFASDRQTWYVFQRELQTRPTIFLGYGMRDAGVLQALHDSASRTTSNRWILLRTKDDATKRLYESLGFHVLVGEVVDFLDLVEGLEAKSAIGRNVEKFAFTGEVPRAGQVAQRPIRNFFLGADPEWSDAFSAQVVRRRLNSVVKNSILSGAHVALVGVPLSGKTTILKQVAAELSIDRSVLYFDRISEPLAEKVISEHKGSGDRALIFVDNLIDSRNAIFQLTREIAAQIVCSENSLYFDSVNLRQLRDRMNVHSCSELSRQDLQKIIESIPIDVRRWRPDQIDIIEAETGDIGLFESLRRHVLDEGLTSRFKLKLAEFEAKDREAFDVYIMACYVAACRTIVSFDMIYMFLDRVKKKYGEVYQITSRIGGFLAEVSLDDDPHQDYFSVRSGALASIALRLCADQSFGRVYNRFHLAVPTRVIVDYQVFRRYAYDNDFARRAYPNVADGLSFYRRLVNSTDNAYDYQHGAIYLSKMKSFTDAFSWIDTAMSKTRGGRVFSIRNTHARILFEANIDVLRHDSRNRTALEGIRESMNVLKNCIENDQRRSYHLLRFSDQALQYGKIVEDRESLDWLLRARDRLKEMIDQASVSNSHESYNLRKYKNLYNEVRAALGRRSMQ